MPRLVESPPGAAIANELDRSRKRPDRQESRLHSFLTPGRRVPGSRARRRKPAKKGSAHYWLDPFERALADPAVGGSASMPRRFSFESRPMREMPRMRAAALRFPLV